MKRMKILSSIMNDRSQKQLHIYDYKNVSITKKKQHEYYKKKKS